MTEDNEGAFDNDPLKAIDELASITEGLQHYHVTKARQHLAAANAAGVAYNQLATVRPYIAKAIEAGDNRLTSPVWDSIVNSTAGTVSYANAKSLTSQPIVQPDESIYATFHIAYSGLRIAQATGTFLDYHAEDFPQIGSVFQIDATIDQPPKEQTDWLALSSKGHFPQELESVLSEFDPKLLAGIRGAWQTFYSNSEDKNRQAAHSMRETLNQLLAMLAPDGELRQSGVQPRTNKTTLYGNDQRIQHIAEKYQLDEADTSLLLTLFDELNRPRRKLVVAAHGKPGEPSDSETEADLKLCDNALTQLLMFVSGRGRRR